MKEAYIAFVDKYVGYVIPMGHKRFSVGYTKRENFVQFVEAFREDYPDITPHCVINEGIEEKIMEKVKLDKILFAKQLLDKKTR